MPTENYISGSSLSELGRKLLYLTIKSGLKSFTDVRRICQNLDPYLRSLTLKQINGDVVWGIAQRLIKKDNKPATVNRFLVLIRNLLKTARDEW